MVGNLIGTYRVLHAIGQGGMGTVYLAEHVLLGRRVALKVLLPNYSRDHDIVRRFFNEARAVTSISDPGIVQIFDFGFHADGSAYLVMELLEGEPLDARLRRRGRLSPLDAVRLVRMGAASLATVHARGIVHRDLKPENLFAVADPAVAGGERLKILDFGIAKLLGDDVSTSRTRTGVVLGTPIYMSPEQCRGMGEISFRSDVYSLGCVLFALLTGRPPFLHESSGELIVAHLTEQAPVPSDVVAGVPRELDDIVRRCLAKAPGERYASMQALGQALDIATATALSPSAPASSRPPPLLLGPAAVTTLRAANGQLAVAPAVPSPRRRRAPVITASAGLAIALGFGAVAMLGRDSRGSAASASLAVTPAPPAAAAPPPPAVVSAPAVTAHETVPPRSAATSAEPAPATPPAAAPRASTVATPRAATAPLGNSGVAAPSIDAGAAAPRDVQPAASLIDAGDPARARRTRPRPAPQDPHAAATTDSATIDRDD